ncbi:DUF5956 family protein [Paenarthrobacter sp. NPDC057355]|uniref:DUF5956 family protein n=1 Tax=Paenarthrobacter sp. NPDC057355 TaxID=3346105 RepID=UPI0036383A84
MMVNMTQNPWECAELSEAPQDWIFATENGWGALVLWAVGPGNFVRVRRGPRERFGSVVHPLAGVGKGTQQFRLSEADSTSIDEDIDAYLSDASIPPRPRGFDWFIRRPSNKDLDDETFWADIWAATIEQLPVNGLRPSTMAGPARDAVASLYRD